MVLVERGQSSTAGVQPRKKILGAVQPALEGVDPTESRTPDGRSPDRDAEKRMLIKRELMGRVRPNALSPPVVGLRASRSLGGVGSTQSLGGRGSFRPLAGVGAQPFGGTRPGAIGAQPFNRQGATAPLRKRKGAGGGKGGG